MEVSPAQSIYATAIPGKERSADVKIHFQLKSLPSACRKYVIDEVLWIGVLFSAGSS